MKKRALFLTAFLCMALLLFALPGQPKARAEGPIESVEIQDINCWIWDCSWMNTDSGEFRYYEYMPQTITVVAEGVTYTGSLDDVINQLEEVYDHQFSYWVTDPQTYDNQWGVGSNPVSFSFGGVDGSYNVIISNPIESVSIEDEEYLVWDCWFTWDEEAGEYWRHYEHWPQTITVVADGERYCGDPSEVVAQLQEVFNSDHFAYGAYDPQSYENQWGIGSHPVVWYFGGIEYSFNVVVFNPIESVAAEDVNCWGWEYGERWNEEAGEYWRHYNCDPQTIMVVAEGVTYTGALDEVYDQLEGVYGKVTYGSNFPFEVTDPQTYENQWGIGTHPVSFSFGEVDGSCNVIISTPVESVAVEDMVLYEWDRVESIDWIPTAWDEYGNEIDGEEVCWMYYSALPESLTVVADGNTYSGSYAAVYWALQDAYGFVIPDNLQHDQSYDHPWAAGNTYSVTFNVGGISADYQVSIKANPIESVTAEEDVSCWAWNYGESWSEEAGECWKVYSYGLPQTFTVVAGSVTYTGTLDEVRSQLEDVYGIWFPYEVTDTQSYDNQWGVGTHPVSFSLGGVEGSYNVIITTPIESVTVEDMAVYEWDGSTTSEWVPTAWDEYGNEIDGEEVYWTRYYALPKSLTVVADGKTYSGNYNEVVYGALQDAYGFAIPDELQHGQSRANPWTVGNIYSVTYTIGGISVDYQVSVKSTPIESVTAEDVTHWVWECGDGWDWIHYSYYPQIVTVVAEGVTYAGTLSEVRGQLEEVFNCWIPYVVDDPQSYENQWGIGSHPVNWSFGGVEGRFNVTIATPVESVTIEDAVRYEWESWESSEWIPIAWDEYGDESDWEEVFWTRFPEWPKLVTVVAEGNTYSGTPDEVRWALEEAYGDCITVLKANQDHSHPWTVGNTYPATYSIGGISANYQVTIKASPIESVTVEDMVLYEWDGSQTSDWVPTAWDEYGGEIDWEEVYWTQYNEWPKYVTVVADGNTYSGTRNEVQWALDEAFDFAIPEQLYSGQNYENSWTVGNTYTVTYHLGGVSTDYQVSIKSTPIDSVTAEDVACWAWEYDWWWDDEAGEDWKHYSCEPQTITVVAEGVTYTGTLGEVRSQLEDVYGIWFPYEVTDSQSFNSQWGIGTHPVSFSFGGVEGSYNVIITTPIESVTVEDMVLYEWDGSQTSDWVPTAWDEYGDVIDEEEVFWTRYSAWPKSVTVVAGGNTYSGNDSEVYSALAEAYGFTITDDLQHGQSYDHPWTAGNTYPATYTIGGISADYQVTIKATPIESVTVEDMVLYKWAGSTTSDWVPTAWDEYGDEIDWEEVDWIQYNEWPKYVTVVADGNTYSGTRDEVQWALDEAYDFAIPEQLYSGQNYENSWTVGNTYTVTYHLGGVSTDYQVSIKFTPIDSVTAEDVACWAWEHGWWWDDEAGESKHYYNPETITVVAEDVTYTGTLDEVREQLENEYGTWFPYEVTDSQSFNSQWGIGTHPVSFSFGGVEGSYNVIITTPIESVTVEDMVLYEWDGSQTSSWVPTAWDEYGDVIDEEEVFWTCYAAWPKSVTVVAGGNTYSGTDVEVYNALAEAYGFTITDDLQHGQSHDNPWTVGNTYPATYTIGGVSADYQVTIKTTPIESVTAQDVTISALDYEWLWNDDAEEYWKHYDHYPETVTVVAEGISYTGSLLEVRERLENVFFISFGFDVMDPQSYENQWGVGTYPAILNFGEMEAEYTVTITEPIVITSQPVSMELFVGEEAYFSLDALGEELSYQWQLSYDGGESWSVFPVVEPEFRIVVTAVDNLLQFRCVVSNGEGAELISEPAILTVKSRIETQPVDASAEEGDTIQFTVGATGPGLTYQWQYKNPNGNWTNSGSAGAKTATVKFKTLNSFDGKQFRCIITDENGNQLTSNAATVHMIINFAITEQPVHVSATEGDQVQFSVTAVGDGLSYQWQYKNPNGNWTNSGSAGAKTATVSFKAMSSYNKKQFRCIVTDAKGNQLISNAGTLTMQSAITGQPVNVSATEGEQVQFSVTAVGPGLTYQWQYKNPNGNWTNSGSVGAKTATVSFKALSSYNGKQFRCIITDANGNQLTSNAGTLTMKSAITKQPVNVSALEGDQVQFSVTAVGPGLKYQWQYKNPNGNWTNSGSAGAKTATVSFKALSGYNKKQFRCIITDANGNQLISNAGTITMKSAITGQPVNVSASNGEQVQFSVTAVGPGLKYQWQYKNPNGNWTNSGSAGAKTATVSFKALSSYNGKQFRCIITDANGNQLTSNAGTLTMKSVATQITGQPTNVSASDGAQVQFSVTAVGEGLTYQWQFKDPGGSWKNSSSAGAKTATVKFKALSSYNGKQYRCVITDAKGKQFISDAATLTMK